MSSSQHQDFVSSMTFAGPRCDCDECDLPPSIAAAVQKRKATHNYGANKRVNIRQSRLLVARHGGYSVWKLELPADCGGDPIVELRNSWRILFVEELAEVSYCPSCDVVCRLKFFLGEAIINITCRHYKFNP